MSNSTTCTTRQGNPRACYSTQEEAQSAAHDAEFTYGNAMVPYLCGHCHNWHLCPKDRHTPSETCDYCTDSKGNPKQLYTTKAAAEKRARIRGEEDGITLYVYECRYSNGWHLTKSFGRGF